MELHNYGVLSPLALHKVIRWATHEFGFIHSTVMCPLGCLMVNPLSAETGIFSTNQVLPWFLMTWLPVSPGHQQLWHWCGLPDVLVLHASLYAVQTVVEMKTFLMMLSVGHVGNVGVLLTEAVQLDVQKAGIVAHWERERETCDMNVWYRLVPEAQKPSRTYTLWLYPIAISRVSWQKGPICYA